MHQVSRAWLIFALVSWGCAEIEINTKSGDTDSTTAADADTDADGDADADADADTDADTDGDADGDTDTGTGSEPQPCEDEDDCDGGPCVDGWCCDNDCKSACWSCGLEGSEGICTPIPAGQDPDDDCEPDEPETCGLSGWCDGAGACAHYGPETPCDDQEPCTADDACDGAGNCAGQVPTDCDPGVGNQCCVGGCSTELGCYTTATDCPPFCSANEIAFNQECQCSGEANAVGLCTDGASYICDQDTHIMCQEVWCDSVRYFCNNAGGTWAWRTSAACDDGDPCSFGDACFGGTCNGTSLTCASDACMLRACDGTSTCAETPVADSVSCDTANCPADACDVTTWLTYDDECTRYCDGLGACDTCSCSPASTSCTATGCCDAVCTPATGCSTAAGSCPGVESCGINVIEVASFCSGCGPAGAHGTCGGGGTFVCDAATHDECQSVSCGGDTYYCTFQGGTWRWRTSPACDDGDLCTHNDVCGGGVCGGTPVDCTSTNCMQRQCNGTATCTQTPMSDSTVCGSTDCPGDYCQSSVFYDYPASCNRFCNGAGVCNSCTCTAAQATCAAGASNQCCTVTCSGAAGCGTAAGTCAETCTNNTLTVGRTCTGCGANNANGTCAGGSTYTCNASTYTLCQTIGCGGSTRYCTNTESTWQWRTGTACNDGNLCTYNDYCSGGSCIGTTITCTSDYCNNRACNGTASCTVTPINRCGDGTCNCGETNATCPADCGCALNNLQAFDTSALPANWSTYDGDGYGNDWAWRNTNPPPGGSGGYWECNSDSAGQRLVDDYLITGAYSRGSCSTVTLEYNHYFYWYSSDDSARVYISVDGGDWQQVVQYSSDNSGHRTHNLTTFLGANSSFSIAFRYRAYYGWYWRLDNIRVHGS